jgi:hypothetical protein
MQAGRDRVELPIERYFGAATFPMCLVWSEVEFRKRGNFVMREYSVRCDTTFGGGGQNLAAIALSTLQLMHFYRLGRRGGRT